MAISNAMSTSLLSANSSMKMVRMQQGVKRQMEGKAGILKAEIKKDGGISKAKQEELEAIEAKAKDVENSQMDSLSDMNSRLKQAAKEDVQEKRAEKAAEKKESKKANEKKEAEKAAAKKKAEAKAKEEKVKKDAQENKTGDVDVETGVIIASTDGLPESIVSIDIVSDGISTNADRPEIVGGNVDVMA